MSDKKQNKKDDCWANRLNEVYEDWGNYMDYKKSKLEEQYKEEAANDFQEASSLFKGIAIFVNGYTDPPSDELRRIMMAHGGIFHHYLRTGKTTHMIATNLPYSKIIMYKKAQNPLPLCKPEWITDSIKAGKVLDYRKYLLYSHHTKTQPQLNIFEKVKINNSNKEINIMKKDFSANTCKEKNAGNKETEVISSTEIQNKTIGFLSAYQNPQAKENNEMVFETKNHVVKALNNGNNTVTITTSTSKTIVQNVEYKINEKSELSSTLQKPQKNVIKEAKEMTFQTKLSEEGIALNKDEEIANIDSKLISKESVLNKPLSSSERNCTKNSEFLTEFYNNSRLHHISTMGMMFKEYINDLRDKNTDEFPGLLKLCSYKKKNNNIYDSDSDEDTFGSDELNNKKEKILMHIDMDCFFVSVGLRNNPELRGFPIAVAHAKGNKYTTNDEEMGSMSEIASCSYEARKAGVKNGMFLGQALKLCPNLKTIRYDFEGYKEVSYALYDTVASYTLQIEAVSCDEMYVDCTELLHKSKLSSMIFADILRKEIKEKTGCPVSTGFGCNKLQARLATKLAKPDGQFHLKSQNFASSVDKFAIKDLPGVGYTIATKLQQMGVNNCSDLQKISIFNLQQDFGKKTGELLYNLCHGIDHSKLNLEHIRKSVSAEVNYGIRFESEQDAIDFLKKLCIEICNRLKNSNVMGRNITLKLMVRSKEAPKETAKFMGHGLCDCLSKTKNMLTVVDEVSIITKEILSLWHQMQQIPTEIRGIGIQISKLEYKTNKSNSSTLLNFINKAKEVPKKPIPSTSTAPPTVEERSSNIDNETVLNYSQGVHSNVPVAYLNSQNNKSNLNAKKNQTNPENYFKVKKSSVIRSTKLQLPSLKEIDMTVLVELPEDIRNEILNEYKVINNSEPNTSKEKKNDEQLKPKESILNKNVKQIIENEQNKEIDLSFSEVDPEFLAALPEDMKDDVKMYFQVKKKQKDIVKKKSTTGHNWNMFQNGNNTKIIRKRKINIRNTNIGNKKPKIINTEIKKPVVEETTDIKRNELDVEKKKKNEAYKSEYTTELVNEKFCIESYKVNENKELLDSLVKCMLDLPLVQVKEQIQAWISNSEVNEIDLLSIVTYLGMLPKKKRLEDLHILLKTMYRCVAKLRNCVWHETYKKIAEHIQYNMQLEYNSDLMLPPLKCNRCTR